MLTHAIQLVSRSVVHVEVERAAARGGAGRREVGGAGFVVGADGVIATAYHLVREAHSIAIRGLGWSGTVPGSVIATDRSADVALVRIMSADLTEVSFYDGATVPIGTPVAFMGFPYADVFQPPLLHTTTGILSNRYRLRGIDHFVVDAVCAPGISGGPLFLAETGEVIGLVGARFDPVRARAKLRGVTGTELEDLAPAASSITFAVAQQIVQALRPQRDVAGI